MDIIYDTSSGGNDRVMLVLRMRDSVTSALSVVVGHFGKSLQVVQSPASDRGLKCLN